MRVVLDTNVIVSGLNFPGNERRILDLALRGRFELFLSPFILEEVASVLGRKFDWTEETIVPGSQSAWECPPPSSNPGGSRRR